jgi:small subunit ribosomal protein S17
MAKKKETKNENKVEQTTSQTKCDDVNCPFHGTLKIRGKKFTGTVTSTKMHKTATVTWDRKQFVKKYDRYEKRRTKIHVHNPECINAKKADKVVIAECRPISKTKSFVIIERLGEDMAYKQKEEGLEEGKYKRKDEPTAESQDKPIETEQGAQEE